MSTARKPASRNPSVAAENKSNGTPVMFDLDAYQAEAAREPFSFSLGKKTFVLPHMADLDWHASVDSDGAAASRTVHQWLQAGLGGQFAAFDKLQLSADGYNELWRRWQKHCGDDQGEDSASPSS